MTVPASYEVVQIPPERALVVDGGILASKRHIMYGLVEVDVTKARTIMKTLQNRNDSKVIKTDDATTGQQERYPATTKDLSFTAYLAACLARSVVHEPRAQAYKIGRNKQVIFKDVHVSTMIEASNDKGGVAIPHVLRNADKRSVRDLSKEIYSVKADPDLSEQKSGKFAKIATKIPRWLRMIFFRWMMNDPNAIDKHCGTIMLTSVGMMMGKGRGGWCIPHLPLHTVGVTVGGIYTKPAIIDDDGTIGPREFVCLTIAFDHDVIDGAPAARFSSRFADLIEDGDLLGE